MWRSAVPPAPTRADLLPALRVAVSIVLPLVVVAVTGHIDWSLYAVFGAFASVYGRRGSHLDRLEMQSAAGVLLVGCVTAGTAVATMPQAAWVAVPAIAVVAGIAALVSDVLRWRPPGALFAVFAFGACAAVPATTDRVPLALVVSAVAAGFAVLVGAGGASMPLTRRVGRTPTEQRRAGALVRRHVLAYVVAAGCACALATALGLGHAYWAAVAAVVPLSAVDTSHRLSRAWHRFLGTALGLVLAGMLLAPQPGEWAILGLVAVLQVATELFVLRHYATAMVFVTPLALLMTQLPHPQPAGPLVLDRAVTTTLGIVVGVLAVLALHDRSRPDAAIGR